MKKQLIKSSSFRFVEVIASIVLAIILTPYLIHHLGDDNYGLWLLVLSTLGWFNVIDLGFSYAVQREIIFAIEKSDSTRINVIFSVAIVLFSLLGGVAFLSVMVLALYPSLLGVAETKFSTTSIALSLLAFKVFFDFVMNAFHGFFTAYLRMDIDANISLLNTVIKSLLIYYLIIDMNIYGAVIATIIADIVGHSLKIIYAKKLNSSFHFSFKLVSFSEIKSLFSFSKHLIATDVAISINRNVDPVIIAHILGLKMVAFYGVVNNLTKQIEGVVEAIAGVFQPAFTKLVAKNTEVNALFGQAIKVNFFIVLVLFSPLSILAEDFITLWIGEEYAKAEHLIFILSFAYICRSISRPISSLLQANAQHQYLSVVNFIGAVVNIILSIILAYYYGIEGIAIATVCAFFLSDVILHLYLLKRHSGLLIREYVLNFFVLNLLFILLVLSGKAFMSMLPPLSWTELILAGVVCLLFSVLLAWTLLLDKMTKQKIIIMITKREG